MSRCISGANLVIVAQIHCKLLCRQDKFPRIWKSNCQNDLEGQGQCPPFSLPAENILRFMFRANLVFPAQICNELSCGQGKYTDGQTDGQTDGRRQRHYSFERRRGKNCRHDISGAWVKWYLVLNVAIWPLYIISADISPVYDDVYQIADKIWAHLRPLGEINQTYAHLGP